MENIKELINKVVDEMKDNDSLKEDFAKDPVKVIEKFLGVDLPDDIIEKVIEGVKAKITIDKVSDVAGALKGLFGKK